MSQHILVAGCQDQTHEVICKLLSRSGMCVHDAGSVEDAMLKLSRKPSLIVIDLALNGGNGLDVVRVARDAGLDTKIAVISSPADTQQFGWIPRYRPDAVFGKPFDFADFTDWLSGFGTQRSASPMQLKVRHEIQPMYRAA